jgi:hypothetical protein
VNLALPALLIFLGVLPGTVCAYAHSRGYWDVSFEQRRLPKTLAYVLIVSGLLHAAWHGLFSWAGLSPQVDSFITLLVQESPQRTAKAVDTASANAGWILLYFLSIVPVAFVLGASVNRLRGQFRLDLHPWTSWLFASPGRWAYILTGEYLLLPTTAADAISPPDLVLVSATVTMGSQTYLYYGRCEEAFFDPTTSKLERIVLADALRRKIDDDRDPNENHSVGGDKGRYYPIEGNYLVLKYQDINSLNVEYAWIERVETAAPQTPMESSEHV